VNRPFRPGLTEFTILFTAEQRLSVGKPPRNGQTVMVFKCPVGGNLSEHREKDFCFFPSAAVCRPVTKKEMMECPAAHKAIQQEWDRLRARKSWDEEHPREWSDVAREARESGEEVHVGMRFGFVVEKNTDLPTGDPRRKFKGRVVFQGNNVKNQNWENAVFSDLGSSPSSMEAGRLVDAYGLRHGFDIQQSDAAQAYLQAELRGNPIWIAIPQDQWPASWQGMRRPVCRLRVALYGHPDSGTDWEHHCDKSLKTVGIQNVGEGVWPSCYLHKELRLLLSECVDGFKMSGPSENLEQGWKLISSVVEVDLPQPFNL
jgi:hypothetical protein